MAWIDEANWPVAWTSVCFSPIVKSGSEYIVYVSGAGVTKLYSYNLTTQTWTELSDPPVSFYNAASLSPDGTKLAWEPNDSRYLYIYNIAGDSWTTSAITPNLTPTGETSHIRTTVWADDNTIWCHVRDGVGSGRNKCFKYVVSTNTWSQYTNRWQVGPYSNSKGISINTAGLALYVGGVHAGADRHLGFKYVIATDTYSQIACQSGFNWLQASDRSARLWTIDSLTSYLGNEYYDCDTETVSAIVFPNDSERTHSSQNLPCGLYEMGYIIAYHKSVAPQNRSYRVTTAPTVTTDPATEVT